jgi:thiamine monophosphate kinase
MVEDYELLFVMEDFDKIKSQSKLSIIGHMTQESEEFILLPEQILKSH